MMNAKLYTILFSLILLFTITHCTPKNDEIKSVSEYEYDAGIPWDCKRYAYFSDVITIDSYINVEKVEKGSYPRKLEGKLRDRIQSIFGTEELNDQNSKYTSNGKTFTFKLILPYKICVGDKFTVVKMTNSAIYWKDNFAEPGQTVKDINWKKVDFIVCQRFIDENGYPKRTECNPPEIPYPKGTRDAVFRSRMPGDRTGIMP